MFKKETIFDQGVESTSHKEAIWNIIKNKIKSIYNIMPYGNFMKFVRKAEYSIKIKENLKLIK